MSSARAKLSAATLSSAKLSRRAWLAGCLAQTTAWGLGRRPLAGELALGSLWSLAALDPHATDEPAGAVFGGGLFDPLFDVDAQGHPYPALASGMPESAGKRVRIELRPGLVTAGGQRLDARDVVYALERAQRGAARVALSGWTFHTVPRRAGSVEIGGASVTAVATALASPATALVPRGFDPRKPDGTGGFGFVQGGRGQSGRGQGGRGQSGQEMRWVRNPRAARGGAFLDLVRLRSSSSVEEQLRAFEARELDLGWLLRGLHAERSDVKSVELPAIGWITLHTGTLVGRWATPGVAQRILDGLLPNQLAGLGVDVETNGEPTRWGGPRAELWIPEGEPQLWSVGNALAAALGAPAHEVVPVSKDRVTIRRAVVNREFPLLLDFVRRVTTDPNAHGSEIAAVLGRTTGTFGLSPRVAARSLPLGVVGVVRPNAWLSTRFAAPRALSLSETSLLEK